MKKVSLLAISVLFVSRSGVYAGPVEIQSPISPKDLETAIRSVPGPSLFESPASEDLVINADEFRRTGQLDFFELTNHALRKNPDLKELLRAQNLAAPRKVPSDKKVYYCSEYGGRVSPAAGLAAGYCVVWVPELAGLAMVALAAFGQMPTLKIVGEKKIVIGNKNVELAATTTSRISLDDKVLYSLSIWESPINKVVRIDGLEFEEVKSFLRLNHFSLF